MSHVKHIPNKSNTIAEGLLRVTFKYLRAFPLIEWMRIVVCVEWCSSVQDRVEVLNLCHHYFCGVFLQGLRDSRLLARINFIHGLAMTSKLQSLPRTNFTLCSPFIHSENIHSSTHPHMSDTNDLYFTNILIFPHRCHYLSVDWANSFSKYTLFHRFACYRSSHFVPSQITINFVTIKTMTQPSLWFKWMTHNRF